MVVAAAELYSSVVDLAIVGALSFVLVNLQWLHRTVSPSVGSGGSSGGITITGVSSILRSGQRVVEEQSGQGLIDEWSRIDQELVEEWSRIGRGVPIK